MANTQYPIIDDLRLPHVQMEPLEKLYMVALDALSEETGVSTEQVHLHVVKACEKKDRDNAVE